MAQSETIRKVGFTLLLPALFWVAAASGVWAQSSLSSPQVPQAADSPSTSTQSTGTVLVIGRGDLLKVSIFGAPESDQEVRVDQAGNVSLSFIGSVHVAGLTNTEAQTVIAKRLVSGGFFAQPQVSVFEKEYATQGISVLGGVQHPGIYPIVGTR